mmetsp:Transcript_8275/g.25003  ORF Transcript_8275/g.25003 Transcript_8275/m.25003 type:complete len:154 (-) Transcript_8275:718-1179(-)
MAVVSQNTKPCPGCKMAIDKFDGCHKVVCSSCSTAFCWICLKKIDGYSHFGANACNLFDPQTIRAWNANLVAPAAQAVEDARHRRDAALLMHHHRPANCPMCGQLNARAHGNNGIRCWSCGNRFCALCGLALRGKPGQHFGRGPEKCRQHTPD